MPIIDCDKCGVDNIKGSYTSINTDYSMLCRKCYHQELYKVGRKEALARARKKYYENKKECLQNMKEYAEKNKNKLKKYHHNYYKKNYDRMHKQMKIYYEKILKPKAKEEYQKKKERVKGDIYFKLKENLRSRIGMAIKYQKTNKAKKSLELLGAPIHVVRQHIENQFLPNMSWDNHGDWHIDHIVPCSFFDLTKPSHQKFCFHYTNLQPLWAVDNIRKKDNIV